MAHRVHRGRRAFLSTSSARRTTQRDVNIVIKKLISIHVLREEDDNPFRLKIYDL